MFHGIARFVDSLKTYRYGFSPVFARIRRVTPLSIAHKRISCSISKGAFKEGGNVLRKRMAKFVIEEFLKCCSLITDSMMRWM